MISPVRTLVERDDDREDVVRDRLRVYHQHARALADYYRNRDQLVVVDGSQSIDRVAEAVDESVGAQVRV